MAVTKAATIVATEGGRGLNMDVRFHKATCKRVKERNTISLQRAHLKGGKPASCCKPTAALILESNPNPPKAHIERWIQIDPETQDVIRTDVEALVSGGMDRNEAWDVVLRDDEPAPTKAPAKKAAPKAEPTEAKPTVTYYVNGRPRVAQTSPRPYTFSYLAGEVVGGKGSSAKLREMLTRAGITDPEHTSWDYTLENGKTIGARRAGDVAPAMPEKPNKATAADKLAKLNEMKAEAAARKEAGAA